MKHAYLIIAHKNDYTFQTLLKLLDDERNDIFIHMDKKTVSYDPENVLDCIKKSNVYHVENRNDVVWGDYSQIDTELKLLELATSVGSYVYYHLLSGEDLPLKNQNDIHAFFDINQGKEFLRFEQKAFAYGDRISQYHFLQKRIGRPESHPTLYNLERVSLRFQKLIGIQRNRAVDFQKGSNWFSITDELARMVIEQKPWIMKTFKYSLCCDEVFLQTLVNQSNFKMKLYHSEFDNDLHGMMRLIDWKRGSPYIFRISDREELGKTDLIFARKFDCSVDKEVIDFVAHQLCGK